MIWDWGVLGFVLQFSIYTFKLFCDARGLFVHVWNVLFEGRCVLTDEIVMKKDLCKPLILLWDSDWEATGLFCPQLPLMFRVQKVAKTTLCEELSWLLCAAWRSWNAGGPPPLGLLRAPLSQRSCVFYSAAVQESKAAREKADSSMSLLEKKARKKIKRTCIVFTMFSLIS